MIKRFFDLTSAIIIALLISPFLPFIIIGIKLQSKGPILFKQQRTGLYGKTFTIYKFRSLCVNNNANIMQVTRNDSRIYPLGKFMRNSHIDEIPQLINVIKGDMSMVGPRPHMLYHTKIYSDIVNGYMKRHDVKPGITGLAQALGYTGEIKDNKDITGRVMWDITYIKNSNIVLDIEILLCTVKMYSKETLLNSLYGSYLQVNNKYISDRNKKIIEMSNFNNSKNFYRTNC